MTPAALTALEALVEALYEGEPFASYEECVQFWVRENKIKRIERQTREESNEREERRTVDGRQRRRRD